MVYAYAEEALELVAVNVGQAHQRDKTVVDADTGETFRRSHMRSKSPRIW